MVEFIRRYIKYSIKLSVSWIAVSLVIIAIALLVCRRKGFSKDKSVARSLFYGYTVLVLASTVFCRPSNVNAEYKIIPFWTLCEIMSGEQKYVPELIINILMFIPIGFLLSVFANSKYVILIGGIISISIELLQLSLSRGLCETDDLINNIIGTGIGLALWYSIKFISEQYKEYHK